MRDVLMFVELTIREARRRRIMWLAFGLGLLLVTLYAVGFYGIYSGMRGAMMNVSSLALDSGFNFVVMSGLYGVSFLGVMLAVLVSVGALAGEISSQTIQSLAVKPIPRWRLLLGKWLGLALMLAVYIGMLSGGIVLATWAISGYVPPNAALGIALIIFETLLLLSVGVLGGTRLSTVANGVVAFMLYGLAFVGGWIEQVGAFIHNETAVDIGIITSLVMPSEAMWKLAAYSMQSPAVRALGASPFAAPNAPSAAMVIYALLYTAGMIWWAIRSFEGCDL